MLNSSSLKGTTVYIVAVLINLSNLSLDAKIFSKKSSKVKIWDEMVIKNIGTKWQDKGCYS